MGCSGVVLGSKGPFGVVCGPMAFVWGHLGSQWPCGVPWGFGAIWGRVGPYGAVWGPFEITGVLWGPLGFGGHLGPFGVVCGAIWGLVWPFWDCSGSVGFLWGFEAIRGPMGSFGALLGWQGLSGVPMGF